MATAFLETERNEKISLAFLLAHPRVIDWRVPLNTEGRRLSEYFSRVSLQLYVAISQTNKYNLKSILTI